MHELSALTSRHLRATLRGRAARVGAVLFLLGLAAAVVLPDARRGGGLALLGSLLVLTFFVSGFAVGAGAALPEDRVAGREAWLAALAPQGWKRRLAVVVSGWLLAVGMGLFGGLAVGGLVAALRPALPLRAHSAVALPAEAVLAAGGASVTIDLAPGASHRDLELDVRPLFRLSGVPVDRVRVAWQAGAAQGALLASVRGPLRLQPPAGATSVRLALETPRVRLRLVAARRLGPEQAPWLGVTWAGLLLGLLAGTVVPVAVLFSRVTTAQTASAVAFLLLLFGASKHTLITLAGDLEPEGLMAFAPGLLHAVSWIAPDAPLWHIVAEAGALRAPGAAAAGLLLPALLYTVVVALLACVPAPRCCATGVNA